MLNKIYLLVFAVAVIALAALTFLTSSQLNSIGFAPAGIAENFKLYNGYHWSFVWIASIALLILANAVMWTSRRAWALWLTFLFFAASILLNMWWLSDLYFNYKKTNGLGDGSFNVSAFGAAFFVVIAGIGLFFNQFIVFRLRDKMFAKAAEPATPQIEAEPEPEKDE